MDHHRYVHETAVAAAEACSDYLVARLEETLRARGTATLAISGGSSPKPMFRAMARSGVDAPGNKK